MLPKSRQVLRAKNRNSKGVSYFPICHGYTLLEMLVALVMFGLISVATSFALTAALRNQQATAQRAEELQEVRAIFRLLARDLRGAFASQNNPNSLFIADGNTHGTLLTFTTLTPAIPNSALQVLGANPAPQSDVAIVSYAYDEGNGVLSRTSTSIPNLDTLPSPDMPAAALSRQVRGITFQFFDPTTGTRNDWHYQNEPVATQQGGITLGRDTSLPKAVQVSLELESSDGLLHTYTLTVPLAMPQPLPAGQRPSTPEASGGAGSGGGLQGGGTNIPTGGAGGTGSSGGGGLPGLPGTMGPRG
jgi:type II secretion system protein J